MTEMPSRVLLDFNSDYDCDKGTITEVRALELRRGTKIKENAIRVANMVGCGLLIQVYEDHTVYFLETAMPVGGIREELYDR